MYWQLFGDVNGGLLQEGLCHTQVCCTQCPYPCSRLLLTCTYTGDTQTQKQKLESRLPAAATATAAKSLQSCLTLCDPTDGSPPGSPIPGILQARTLEWVAISFSNAWKWKVKVKSLSRVRLLVTPWTAAYPGSSIHGIFQARVLEWGANMCLN